LVGRQEGHLAYKKDWVLFVDDDDLTEALHVLYLQLSPHRRLADGIVHCAGSATYQIFLGSRTRALTLNPNPKINKKTK